GDAEVDDLRDGPTIGAARHEHVLGLEIAMHDAVLVRVLEPGEDLIQQLARRRRLPWIADPGPELIALEQLHHQVLHARGRGPERGHAHAVWVVQPRRALGFTIEALADRRVRTDVRVQQLERDVSVQLVVVRLVDGTHATGPEQTI